MMHDNVGDATIKEHGGDESMFDIRTIEENDDNFLDSDQDNDDGDKMRNIRG